MFCSKYIFGMDKVSQNNIQAPKLQYLTFQILQRIDDCPELADATSVRYRLKYTVGGDEHDLSNKAGEQFVTSSISPLHGSEAD